MSPHKATTDDVPAWGDPVRMLRRSKGLGEATDGYWQHMAIVPLPSGPRQRAKELVEFSNGTFCQRRSRYSQ